MIEWYCGNVHITIYISDDTQLSQKISFFRFFFQSLRYKINFHQIRLVDLCVWQVYTIQFEAFRSGCAPSSCSNAFELLYGCGRPVKIPKKTRRNKQMCEYFASKFMNFILWSYLWYKTLNASFIFNTVDFSIISYVLVPSNAIGALFIFSRYFASLLCKDFIFSFEAMRPSKEQKIIKFKKMKRE